MWLLSTDRAELHLFTDPASVEGGYAILSHTWSPSGHEQSFEDLQALRGKCFLSGDNPRNLACDKIRRACLLAEAHGYRWIWIDTCCIDKTSSSELSEAINSMFRWYTCSEVCYAYLDDVPSDCELDAPNSAFRNARWHTRGWTLQELIAPQLVFFLSKDWEPLGTKVEHALLLQAITGVSAPVLTRQLHYARSSIAFRMLWASKRQTTRLEDEAYCLMGLFDVNMPTIYGEGRQAFQRLQQEIMKQSFDPSLFAWGWGIRSTTGLKALAYDDMIRSFSAMQGFAYLLADSPQNFRSLNGSVVRFTPATAPPTSHPYLPWQWVGRDEPKDSERRAIGPFGSLELPRFTPTSYGVECRFPVIETGDIIIVVLLCHTFQGHLGLLLHPSPDPVHDPKRKRYRAGYGFLREDTGRRSSYRIILLGTDLYNLEFDGKPVKAEWRDIFIENSPLPVFRGEPSTRISPLNCVTATPPFRVPNWLVSRMASFGLELRQINISSKPDAAQPDKPLCAYVQFNDMVLLEGLSLWLGTCAASPGRSADSDKRLIHWARVTTSGRTTWGQRKPTPEVSHDCSEHHVEEWPGWSKAFGDSERTVRLSFTHCTLTPQTTLALHIELEGSVYAGISRRTGMSVPSREQLGLPTVSPASRVVIPTPPKVNQVESISGDTDSLELEMKELRISSTTSEASRDGASREPDSDLEGVEYCEPESKHEWDLVGSVQDTY
ncbi:HET-domain-containing protein [Daedaleopsis nitida]|nr:HET-domain-containing protein [Daedaleopsis nitida]